MSARRLFFSVLLFLALAVAAMRIKPWVKTAWAPAEIAEPDRQVKDEILAATLVINLLIPARDSAEKSVAHTADGKRLLYFEGTSGLGSVIHIGQDLYVLTHDHWRNFYEPDLLVEFSNAQGHLLTSMNGAMFRTLVQYRDGGTMVLTLPTALNRMDSGLRPTRVRSLAKLPLGATVHFVGRYGSELTVEPLVVIDTGPNKQFHYLEFRSPGGFVVRPGNSGGGVWFDGELIANVSSTLVKGDGRATAKGRASLTPALALAAIMGN